MTEDDKKAWLEYIKSRARAYDSTGSKRFNPEPARETFQAGRDSKGDGGLELRALSEAAMHIAARIWQDQDMSHREMDVELAKEIAALLDWRIINPPQPPQVRKEG